MRGDTGMRRVSILFVFCLMAACAQIALEQDTAQRKSYALRSVRILYYVDQGGTRADKPAHEQFEQSLRALPVSMLRHHFSKMNIDLDTSDFELARSQPGYLKPVLGNYFWQSTRAPANALDLEFGFKTCVKKMDIFQGWSFSMYPRSSFRARLIENGARRADFSSDPDGEPSCDKSALEDRTYFRSDSPSDDEQMRRKVNEYYATKIMSSDFVEWLSTLQKTNQQ